VADGSLNGDKQEWNDRISERAIRPLHFRLRPPQHQYGSGCHAVQNPADEDHEVKKLIVSAAQHK
jgi:hypothetical protein